MNWKKEKEYRERRAQQIGAEMDLAIEMIDKDRFQKAFTTAMNYMTKKDRSEYYRRFLDRYRGRA